MLLVDQLRFKVLAVFLVLALVMPMVMMPVGVARAQYDNEVVLSEPLSEEMVDLINLHGAEIEIVDGSPFIVVAGHDEEIYISFNLPATIDVPIYNKLLTVETDGNYLLIPLEGEIEKTCISELNVKEIKDGQIILEGYINPWIIVIIKVAISIGGLYGFYSAIDAIHDYATTRENQERYSGAVISRGESNHCAQL